MRTTQTLETTKAMHLDITQYPIVLVAAACMHVFRASQGDRNTATIAARLFITSLHTSLACSSWNQWVIFSVASFDMHNKCFCQSTSIVSSESVHHASAL